MELDETNAAIALVIVLILAVGYAVLNPTILQQTIFTDHALTSHSSQVQANMDCFDGNGTVSGPFTTSNNRMSEHCDDGEKGYWRIFVCEGDDKLIITMFKQGLNRMANYMLNHGMEPIEGDPGC